MVIGEGSSEGKVLNGAHVMLRPLTVCDEVSYLEQFSELVRSLLHVTSISQEQSYFHERMIKQQEEKTFFYGIFDADSNILCGALEIRDLQEHRGQLYCWLNEIWWAKGYIQEAIALASISYFAQTDQKFITALVDEDNKRSYWALKYAGFADLAKIEGPYGKQYELILRNKVM